MIKESDKSQGENSWELTGSSMEGVSMAFVDCQSDEHSRTPHPQNTPTAIQMLHNQSSRAHGVQRFGHTVCDS